jgi:hypothetical protein
MSCGTQYAYFPIFFDPIQTIIKEWNKPCEGVEGLTKFKKRLLYLLKNTIPI